MADATYQEAVQALKRRLSGRWEISEEEGRGEMAQVLRDELGYDRKRANDALDAMIQGGTLRYHRTSAADDNVIAVPAVPTGTGGSSTGMGGAGFVGGPGTPLGAPLGYWQIGDDGEQTSRAGQVDPTA